MVLYGAVKTKVTDAELPIPSSTSPAPTGAADTVQSVMLGESKAQQGVSSMQCNSNVHILSVRWSLLRASLIAGMEYGTEQWNGKWNGTANIHSCS